MGHFCSAPPGQYSSTQEHETGRALLWFCTPTDTIINGHVTQAFIKYDDSVYLGGFWLQQIQVELSCI